MRHSRGQWACAIASGHLPEPKEMWRFLFLHSILSGINGTKASHTNWQSCLWQLSIIKTSIRGALYRVWMVFLKHYHFSFVRKKSVLLSLFCRWPYCQRIYVNASQSKDQFFSTSSPRRPTRLMITCCYVYWILESFIPCCYYRWDVVHGKLSSTKEYLFK